MCHTFAINLLELSLWILKAACLELKTCQFWTNLQICSKDVEHFGLSYCHFSLFFSVLLDSCFPSSKWWAFLFDKAYWFGVYSVYVCFINIMFFDFRSVHCKVLIYTILLHFLCVGCNSVFQTWKAFWMFFSLTSLYNSGTCLNRLCQ